LNPATDTGHTKLFWLALRCALRDARLHLLQLRSFRRQLNRLCNRRHWLRALGPLYVNSTLNSLDFRLSRFGFIALITRLCERILVHPRHAVVVAARGLLNNILQDATPTLLGGLLPLRFLLAGDGLNVGLSAQCRGLLLLRAFFSVDSGELVCHIHEITHGSGLLGRNCLRRFRHIHELVGPTQLFRSKPTALLFLLQCKQVRLLKCSFVTTSSGAKSFTLAGGCLSTLFFFRDCRRFEFADHIPLFRLRLLGPL
jgi:hypothetical protein